MQPQPKIQPATGFLQLVGLIFDLLWLFGLLWLVGLLQARCVQRPTLEIRRLRLSLAHGHLRLHRSVAPRAERTPRPPPRRTSPIDRRVVVRQTTCNLVRMCSQRSAVEDVERRAASASSKRLPLAQAQPGQNLRSARLPVR